MIPTPGSFIRPARLPLFIVALAIAACSPTAPSDPGDGPGPGDDPGPGDGPGAVETRCGSSSFPCTVAEVDPAVLDALSRRSWPGNVRELKNVVERAAILSSDVITIADLPEDPHVSPFDEEAESPKPFTSLAPGQRPTLREYRETMERAYIVQVLSETGWNISRAATELGVERTNLHKKVRAYGIRRGEG